jgi:hypothetical protein
MSDFPISSECPKCKHDRAQYGYDRRGLIQLLKTGAHVDAHCQACPNVDAPPARNQLMHL